MRTHKIYEGLPTWGTSGETRGCSTRDLVTPPVSPLRKRPSIGVAQTQSTLLCYGFVMKTSSIQPITMLRYPGFIPGAASGWRWTVPVEDGSPAAPRGAWFAVFVLTVPALMVVAVVAVIGLLVIGPDGTATPNDPEEWYRYAREIRDETPLRQREGDDLVVTAASEQMHVIAAETQNQTKDVLRLGWVGVAILAGLFLECGVAIIYAAVIRPLAQARSDTT